MSMCFLPSQGGILSARTIWAGSSQHSLRPALFLQLAGSSLERPLDSRKLRVHTGVWTLLPVFQKSPVGWKNFWNSMIDAYAVLRMLRRALVGSLLVMDTEGWVLRTWNTQWRKIKIMLDLWQCAASCTILLQLRMCPRMWGFSS